MQFIESKRKPMKKNSAFVKEMQIKTTMSHYFKPIIRLVKIEEHSTC